MTTAEKMEEEEDTKEEQPAGTIGTGSRVERTTTTAIAAFVVTAFVVCGLGLVVDGTEAALIIKRSTLETIGTGRSLLVAPESTETLALICHTNLAGDAIALAFAGFAKQ